MQSPDFQLPPNDRKVVVNLIIQMLREKPADPVPFMYSYLKQIHQGVENPVCPTNKQIAEIKNLRKKLDYLQS